MRPARALIDLQALRHNYRLARELTGAKALAVIKADAIKFLMTFRNQLVSKEGGQHLQVVPLLALPSPGATACVGASSFAASRCVVVRCGPSC